MELVSLGFFSPSESGPESTCVMLGKIKNFSRVNGACASRTSISILCFSHCEPKANENRG